MDQVRGVGGPARAMKSLREEPAGGRGHRLPLHRVWTRVTNVARVYGRDRTRRPEGGGRPTGGASPEARRMVDPPLPRQGCPGDRDRKPRTRVRHDDATP